MTTTSGVLLSGSDGAAYFIPDEVLATYQLTDAAAQQVYTAMAGRTDTHGFSLPEPLPQVRRLAIATGLLQYRDPALISAPPMPLPSPSLASATPIQLP